MLKKIRSSVWYQRYVEYWTYACSTNHSGVKPATSGIGGVVQSRAEHRALINNSHFVKNVSLRDLLSRLFVVIATHQKKTANGGHTRRAPSLTLTEKERERTILQTSGGVCVIASHLNLRERVFEECFATLLVFKVCTWGGHVEWRRETQHYVMLLTKHSLATVERLNRGWIDRWILFPVRTMVCFALLFRESRERRRVRSRWRKSLQ